MVVRDVWELWVAGRAVRWGGVSLSLSLGPFVDPTVDGLARVCRSCWWCRVETWASHACLPLAMLDLCALW